MVHDNLSKVTRAVVSMVQTGVTAYAKRVILVNDCSGAHSMFLIPLIDNNAAIQLDERPHQWQHKTASTTDTNQPNVELCIG